MYACFVFKLLQSGEIQSYVIKCKVLYFSTRLAFGPTPQAIVDDLNDPDANVRELERFLVAAMAERGNTQKKITFGDAYIDIIRCKKFVVKKMWIGGGSESYKYPEDKI